MSATSPTRPAAGDGASRPATSPDTVTPCGRWAFHDRRGYSGGEVGHVGGVPVPQVPADEFGLVTGWPVPGSQAGVEGGPGALQGADDRCRRDAEQAGRLGGGEANHLAHVYAPSSEGGQRADTARYGEPAGTTTRCSSCWFWC
jgi:hypothetical protein